MLHIPLLRHGKPYRSLDVVRVPHYRTREPFVEISLVVTAITRDQKLIERLLASPWVGRLNLGAIPTNHIQWNQPHEGNLFDHLYARRAFQRAMAS